MVARLFLKCIITNSLDGSSDDESFEDDFQGTFFLHLTQSQTLKDVRTHTFYTYMLYKLSVPQSFTLELLLILCTGSSSSIVVFIILLEDVFASDFKSWILRNFCAAFSWNIYH